MIQDRIIAQVPDLNGQVYDKASKDDPFPSVSLGPSYWTGDDADCIEGRTWTGQIDVWTEGNKGLCEDLADDIATALKGFADTTLIAMHPFEISLVRVMDDPDGVNVHGVIQIEAMIEA
ncbi:DUF3168 domain-containing protein [Paracoccus sp. KR1-242]|uniref:DUF3168 domain-containing protein n=1 Tax=Paracoccus sp. KR1-242 TaxID=3410028 RepID=UPI003C067AB2